jgi:mRNA interferase HigB
MKIINKFALQQYIKQHPDTENWLTAWCFKVFQETWENSEDVIKTFPKATLLENKDLRFKSTVQNFFLLVSLHYKAQIVSIKYIGSLQKLSYQQNTNSDLTKEFFHVWH